MKIELPNVYTELRGAKERIAELEAKNKRLLKASKSLMHLMEKEEGIATIYRHETSMFKKLCVICDELNDAISEVENK